MRMELTYRDIADMTVALCFLWDELIGPPATLVLDKPGPRLRQEAAALAPFLAPDLVSWLIQEEPFPSDELALLAHECRTDYLRSGAAILLAMTKLASAGEVVRQKAVSQSGSESVTTQQLLRLEEPVPVEFTTADLNVISTALGMAGAGYPYPAWYAGLVNEEVAHRGRTEPAAREMRIRFMTLYDRISPFVVDEDVPFPPY